MHCFQPTPHLIRSLGERHRRPQRRRAREWVEEGNWGRERVGIPSCLAAQIISGSEACWEPGSHSHGRLWSGQGYSSQDRDWIGPRLMVSVRQGRPGAVVLLKHMCSQHISACLGVCCCLHITELADSDMIQQDWNQSTSGPRLVCVP